MKYIVLTGASSGIGYSLSYRYAKMGYGLYLIARNKDKLFEMKEDISKRYNVDIHVYPFDLNNNPELIVSEIVKNPNIEILFNNAGFGISGEFLSHDLQREDSLIDVNIKALTRLSYIFGNYFKQKRKGMIVNISSVASMMPGPYMATYYASKAYVSSFSLSLSYELKEYNVKVHALNLPRVDTSFDLNAKRDVNKLKKGIDKDKMAKIIISKIKKRKCVINIGISTKMVNLLQRILPKNLFLKLVGKSLNV